MIEVQSASPEYSESPIYHDVKRTVRPLLERFADCFQAYALFQGKSTNNKATQSKITHLWYTKAKPYCKRLEEFLLESVPVLAEIHSIQADRTLNCYDTTSPKPRISPFINFEITVRNPNQISATPEFDLEQKVAHPNLSVHLFPAREIGPVEHTIKRSGRQAEENSTGPPEQVPTNTRPAQIDDDRNSPDDQALSAFLSSHGSGVSTAPSTIRSVDLSIFSNITQPERLFPEMKGAMFCYELTANKLLTRNQMLSSRLVQANGENYLVFNSIYFSEEECIEINKLLNKQIEPDSFKKVHEIKISRGKSVIVVAKVAQGSKQSVVVYGYSIANPKQLVLQAEALVLRDPISTIHQADRTKGDNICYFTCISNPDDSAYPLILQVYDTTAKKSRIVSKLRGTPNPCISYVQLLAFNAGTDVLMLVRTANNKLRLCLFPADASTYHEYYSYAPPIEISLRDDCAAHLVDFQIDSQANLGEIIGPKEFTSAGGAKHLCYQSRQLQGGQESAKIGLACLVRPPPASNPEQRQQQPLWDWSLHTLRLSQLELHISGEGKDARTCCTESDVVYIELSSFSDIESRISKELKIPGLVSGLTPSSVRFCSRLDRVFCLGHGTLVNNQKAPSFLFLLSFSPSNRTNYSVRAVLRRFEPLKFSPGEFSHLAPEHHDMLMPPVAPRFMIAENPGLRRPTGVMTTGPQKHPLFIAGIQNDDTIFSVYLDDPTGAKTLRVENARDYFEKESPDKNVVNKKYHHVTSISWAETPHGDKFTMAANRFSVITFGLNSSQGTLNV